MREGLEGEREGRGRREMVHSSYPHRIIASDKSEISEINAISSQ